MHPQGRPLTRLVDLNLLELFDIVFKNRSLTAAGAHLGLSQPAISYGVSKLRRIYGDMLFVRTRRGVEPTPVAMQLAGPIASALQIVRGTVEKADFKPSETRRTFRLGLTDVGERLFLPRLAKRLGIEAPMINIESFSPRFTELTAALTSGEIDLAAGFFPGMGKSICYQRLVKEEFVYVMRKGHPAAKGTLTASKMRTLRHVAASPPATLHFRSIEKVLTGPQIRAEIALHVRSFLCVAPIVVETDLVALVPSSLATLVAENLGLCVLKPRVRFPELDVSIYWHRRFQNDPASIWLRNIMIELFGRKRGLDAAESAV
jgi:DNA-binding transcriptional LysR family regulator